MEHLESIKKYVVSLNEIRRREIAFASLIISITTGLFVFEILFDLKELFLGTVILGIIFFISWIFTHKFFKSVKANDIHISDNHLQRFEHGKWVKYPIMDIVKINIKHTSRKSIREVALSFKNGKSILINGIEEFEQFIKDLLSTANKEVVIKKISEPMDFDHPIFYPILGIVLSFTGIVFLKLILRFDLQMMKTLLGIFSIYLFILGIYFFYSKPISKRYGNNKNNSDWIWGTLLIGGSLFLLVLIFLI